MSSAPTSVLERLPASKPVRLPVSVGEGVVAGAIAAIFLGCLISLAWTVGVTVDEPSHFLSGHLYWHGQDNLYPGDMPPLMKIVSGWVPRAMNAPLPRPSHPGWKTRDEWFLALGMMEEMTAAQVQRYFFAARLPMLIFPLGCFFLIWWWGRQLFRPWAAVGAASVFCLSPTVLAHAALVKNDIAASFGYLLFWYCVWRFWRQPDWRNAAWIGVGALAGLLAKFSLAILLPIAPIVILSRHQVFRRWLRRGPRQHDATPFWRRPVVQCCAAFVIVVWVGMLAAWQFRLEPVSAQDVRTWRGDPGIPKLLPKAVRIASVFPLPGAFWRGGMSLVSSNNAAVYLLGDIVPGGHPLYFLVAMAVKVPLSTQILVAIAALYIGRAALRRKLRPGDWCWLVPGFLYLTLASFASLQLGVRLVLPALAFFLLASGKAFEAASSRSLRIAIVALMVWLAGRSAMAYPNYISYFNLLVGDSWHGLRILSDSNVDWGQDLRALKKWREQSGVGRLKVAYFGTENIWAYFTDAEIERIVPPWSAELVQGRTRFELTPGYYAISASLISGQLFGPEFRDYFANFRRLEPVDTAGESIFIYRVP